MSPSGSPTPFQFGLRGVLSLTLFAAIVCTVWRGLGPLWGPVAAWMLLLACMHVVANTCGTRAFGRRIERRRRDEPSRRPLGESSAGMGGEQPTPARASIENERCDDTTTWTRRERTAFAAATAGGVGLGAVCGLVHWWGEPWTTFTLTGMAVASVSLAALGGLTGALSALAGPAVWRALRQSN